MYSWILFWLMPNDIMVQSRAPVPWQISCQLGLFFGTLCKMLFCPIKCQIILLTRVGVVWIIHPLKITNAFRSPKRIWKGKIIHNLWIKSQSRHLRLFTKHDWLCVTVGWFNYPYSSFCLQFLLHVSQSYQSSLFLLRVLTLP